jgi:hypothetical protein
MKAAMFHDSAICSQPTLIHRKFEQPANELVRIAETRGLARKCSYSSLSRRDCGRGFNVPNLKRSVDGHVEGVIKIGAAIDVLDKAIAAESPRRGAV